MECAIHKLDAFGRPNKPSQALLPYLDVESEGEQQGGRVPSFLSLANLAKVDDGCSGSASARPD
jgi:hypothetical protein